MEPDWVIVTVSLDTAHGLFDIVQTNLLMPDEIPVTEVVGLDAFAIVPLPTACVQIPVPTVGLLPARFTEVAQTDWDEPAAAFVGGAFRVMITVSPDEHVPFEIVHIK